ncbi:hypothetical protein [Rhizobium lentis]|uniref:hypothetical protein n=1 Tax=Rhizobium lentis TaxID=1138194 RepID=UPI001C830193|nr:hypothetical protein [Rhizobium lentis]MBX4989383.1 hypothetical protein [Rhizobium lentis]
MTEEMMDITPRANALEFLAHLETELRLGKRSCYSRAELVDAFHHVRRQVAAHENNPKTPGLLVRIDQDLAEISR